MKGDWTVRLRASLGRPSKVEELLVYSDLAVVLLSHCGTDVDIARHREWEHQKVGHSP